MKIAVIGAGGVGSVFGGRLTAAGHEVWLVHRRREVVNALRRDGLRLDGPRGTEQIPVLATDVPAEVGPVDLALILTKSTDTRAAAQAAATMLGDTFVAVTLQNGLGNLETIADAVGPERVLLGMTYVGAAVLGPGHVRHTAEGQTFSGEPFAPPVSASSPGRPTRADLARLTGQPADAEYTAGGNGLPRNDSTTAPMPSASKPVDTASEPSERSERVARLFSEAGLPTVSTDRVWDEVWGKLLINVAMNATCALTGASGEAALRSDACRQFLGLVANETAAVAAALGICLPYPEPAERVWRHCRDVGPSRPSMLQDFERQRPTEIDAINGAVVREGARLGIPTPYSQALLLLVKAHEDIARSQATANA